MFCFISCNFFRQSVYCLFFWRWFYVRPFPFQLGHKGKNNIAIDIQVSNGSGKESIIQNNNWARIESRKMHCWKIEAILLWNNCSCKVRVMAQFLNQFTHMWLHWLLLGTCDYIDCNIEVNTRLSSKSPCTHMWLHWLLLSHMRKLNY